MRAHQTLLLLEDLGVRTTRKREEAHLSRASGSGPDPRSKPEREIRVRTTRETGKGDRLLKEGLRRQKSGVLLGIGE
jgi:hypothetical protein